MAFKETVSEIATSSKPDKLDFNADKLIGSETKESKSETKQPDNDRPINPDKLIEPNDSYKNIPLEKSSLGEWRGERGNSMFIPASPEARAELKECGYEGIEYKNGDPDFSPISKAQVQIEGFTDKRLSKIEDGNRIVGNYEKAEIALAKQLNSEGYENRTNWTSKDIENMRKEQGLTWHECRDMKTMQLVPTATHDACRHTGGIAEYKKENNESGVFYD